MFHKNMYLESLKTLLNPVLHTDSYKLSHNDMEPEGTEVIYANFIPRFDHYFKDMYPEYDGRIVVAGTQQFVLKELIYSWNEGFFNRDRTEVLEEIRKYLFPYLGMDHAHIQHFGELHDLGYLPLRVKALPEGTITPLQVPTLTVVNTHPSFSWLTNYIESVLSAEIWKPMTIATVARELRRVRNHWFDLTVDDHTFKNFAVHDFSYRGQANHASSASCGTSALMFSNGTDNVPAVVLARALYLADENVAGSVPASEHSVTTLGINHYGKTMQPTGELAGFVNQLKVDLIAKGLEDEIEQAVGELLTIYNLLTVVYPSGIFSYVSDSYDYWRVITVILPILKPVILRREGKIVVRPDSGDPVDIVVGTSRHVIELEELDDLHEVMLNAEENDRNTYIVKGTGIYVELSDCLFDDRREYGSDQIVKSFGSVESILQFNYLTRVALNTDTPEWKGSIQCLWETFGGRINALGYKELDQHVGLIYGDGITYNRAVGIYSGLAAKGFAANNVVLGVGSYTFAGGTRDSLGFAIKATYAQVDGVPTPIYKKPKTDVTKKSTIGLLCVVKDEETGELRLLPNVTPEVEQTGELQVIFEDGEIYNFNTFQEIRETAGWSL